MKIYTPIWSWRNLSQKLLGQYLVLCNRNEITCCHSGLVCLCMSVNTHSVCCQCGTHSLCLRVNLSTGVLAPMGIPHLKTCRFSITS